MALYTTVTSATAGGQVIQNVLHWIKDGPNSGADAAYIAQRVNNTWGANVAPLLHTGYQMTGTDCYAVTDRTIGSTSTDGNNGGDSGGDMLPTYVSLRVAFQTGFRGGLGKNRTGLGPLSEAQVNGNQVSPDVALAFRNGLVQFFSTVENGVQPFLHVALSTVVNGAPRPVPIASEVQSFTVSTLIGSRISRKER